MVKIMDDPSDRTEWDETTASYETLDEVVYSCEDDTNGKVSSFERRAGGPMFVEDVIKKHTYHYDAHTIKFVIP